MATQINRIPTPNVALTDPKTGLIDTYWWDFLSALTATVEQLNATAGNGDGGSPAVTELPPRDPGIRVAAGPGAGGGYYVGPVMHNGGNGLWLWDDGQQKWRYGLVSEDIVTTPYDIRNISINGIPGQTVFDETLYYIYARFENSGDTYFAFDLSETTPLGNFDFGFAFMNDGAGGYDLTRRWIGQLRTKADGQLWDAGPRGVFYNGNASLYNPQTLNYHIHYETGGNTNTSWAELDSAQYIGAMVMGDDGIEEYVTFSGDVISDTVGAIVSIGVGRAGVLQEDAPENPPYDKTEVTIDTAGVPYPFSVTVSGGDQPSDVRYYRIMGMTTAGAYGITNGTLAMYLRH